MAANAQPEQALSNTNLDEVGYPGLVGTAGGGSATTITLTGGAAVDDVYNGAYVRLTGGQGEGQDRLITDYEGGTGVATVTPAWATTPNVTSTFAITGISGIAQAPGAPSVGSFTLAATASAVDDIYTGATVRINEGTGSGQVTQITSYNGATKVATVAPQWTTVPDATSIYSIFGESGTVTLAAALRPDQMQLSADAFGASDDFYVGQYLDLTASSGASAVGQVRKIVAYSASSRRVTLNKVWSTVPSGTVSYTIFGGWGSDYTKAVSDTFVSFQVSVPDGQAGWRYTYMSLNSSGVNNKGVPVSHREGFAYGNRYNSTTPGLAIDGSPVPVNYLRVRMVAFSGLLQGGVAARFSDTLQSTAAVMDVAGGTTVGGGGSAVDGLPPLGQALMADSLPVAVASDQSAFPVNIQASGVSLTQTANALDVNIASGAVNVTPVTYTPFRSLNIIATAGTQVYVGAATLGPLTVTNRDPTLYRYLKVYDIATTPAAGDAGSLIATYPLPGGSTQALLLNFTISNGIGLRATTELSDADNNDPAVNDIVVALGYAV